MTSPERRGFLLSELVLRLVEYIPRGAQPYGVCVSLNVSHDVGCQVGEDPLLIQWVGRIYRQVSPEWDPGVFSELLCLCVHPPLVYGTLRSGG